MVLNEAELGVSNAVLVRTDNGFFNKLKFFNFHYQQIKYMDNRTLPIWLEA